MASRIAQLEGFVNEDPNDPFSVYALALEYSKTNVHKALELFVQLQKKHADYVPTYYQLGKLYIEMSENQKALEVFDLGISKARVNKDQKALRELQSARQELETDLED